ncbi:MAG: tetratricopeptide repeat protein, partial [Ignavibacteriae bacterium]|nr:tetratricopeptide repeat protein [Ignavibacteriota bacterium]
LGPILERLAEENNDKWVLAKLDTDRHQEIATQYGIRGIPNVKLFVDGVVTNEFTGALPEYAVAKWLEKAVPDRFRKDVETAQRMIKEGKVGEVREVLEKILAEDPNNEAARVLMARTCLAFDISRAEKLVVGIEEHSEHFSEAEAILTAASMHRKKAQPDSLPEDPVKGTYLEAIDNFVRDKFDLALTKFIEVIRENRYYDDDGSRKACIAIFRILGEGHAIAQKHRRDFGSALNV